MLSKINRNKPLFCSSLTKHHFFSMFWLREMTFESNFSASSNLYSKISWGLIQGIRWVHKKTGGGKSHVSGVPEVVTIYTGKYCMPHHRHPRHLGVKIRKRGVRKEWEQAKEKRKVKDDAKMKSKKVNISLFICVSIDHCYPCSFFRKFLSTKRCLRNIEDSSKFF